MNLYYKNGNLYVEMHIFGGDAFAILEKRVFQIIEDYGIDKVVIQVLGECDKNLFLPFKKNFYRKYNGYLVIR